MNKQEKIEVSPIKNVDAELTAPPSKAHTLRSIFIGALAKGKTKIKDPLMAKDQKYAIKALKQLGVDIKVNKEENIVIEGCDGKFKAPEKDLYIGNSGMTARALVPMVSLANGEVTIDGTERMRTGRPMDDLLNALKPLGVDAVSLNGNGCPPIRVKGTLEGGKTELKGNKSSQYFTAILISSPYAKEDTKIKTIGELHSKPYIGITFDVMKEFGVDGENKNYKEFTVESGQRYKGREYQVEGDYSNAAYFFAAAAITQGKVKVNNLNPDSSQGDKKFLDFIEEMGCEVNKGENYIEVIGKPLKGIEKDMEDYPDIVQPLAVVAAFAEGKSKFYNIAHLKYKETDRLKAPVKELKKMGINAKHTEDSIVVEGGEPKGAEIDTYDDHRMAMSFAVAGLAVPNVEIKNPQSVQKSFPEFFDVLEEMR